MTATLELSINKNVKPFAISAALKYLQSPILAKYSSDISTHTLVVGTQHVKGTCSILRYLARSIPAPAAFYPESDLTSSTDMDNLMDHARAVAVNPKNLDNLLSLLDKQSVKAVTIANLVTWDVLLNLESPVDSALTKYPNALSWWSWINAQECAKWAVAEISSKAGPSAVTSNSNKATPAAKTLKFPDIVDDCVLAAFRLHIGQILAPYVPDMEAKNLGDILDFAKPNAVDVDFCVPVQKLRLKGVPVEVAEALASKMKPTEYVPKIYACSNYIHFVINKPLLASLLLPRVLARQTVFGTNTNFSDKTVVVEFSSPNIAKPFHAGHLRSTIIGNFIRNACIANGMKVVTINYLGDWGKQYGLLAVGFKKYGNEEALLKNPIMHLFDVYVKISADAKENESVNDEARLYFKKMEDGDQEALALWSKFRDLSIEKYKQIYARLNVQFDIYSGESQYQEGMKRALNHLKEKGLLSESNGAVIVDLEKYKLIPAVVQKADGATLYLTRDIAAAWERHDQFKFDEMIYVVAAAQDLHFQQLFKILEISGFEWAKHCTHINFGMVKGMSTRKGNVVFLEDILDEAQNIMHDVMKKNTAKYEQITHPEETANTIGLSAVMIQDMSARRIKDYEFNWARMTSFEGDTGPYLQYCHTRLASIERKFLEHHGLKQLPEVPPQVFTEKLAPKAQDLVFFLSTYPDMVRLLPSRSYESASIVQYLFSACHKVSACLESCWVLGDNVTQEESHAHFWVYWMAKNVLGNGMRLLGLKPLDRM